MPEVPSIPHHRVRCYRYPRRLMGTYLHHRCWSFHENHPLDEKGALRSTTSSSLLKSTTTQTSSQHPIRELKEKIKQIMTPVPKDYLNPVFAMILVQQYITLDQALIRLHPSDSLSFKEFLEGINAKVKEAAGSDLIKTTFKNLLFGIGGEISLLEKKNRSVDVKTR
eukprot:TRINITY_DN8173_c0_g1_i1.p1 TRINITY_DN8173_c0_g1~~TRINITY_DN8173_c0_g1_i1.p1  ORF type:complete len:167 (+),score=35.36 TRINITY_DN8173_c0_g1_i1:19-519(+)